MASLQEAKKGSQKKRQEEILARNRRKLGQLAARLGRGLLVVAFRSFGHQAFFNGLSGDPDIFHLSINDDLDPL